MKPLLAAAVGGLILGVSLPPFGLWFLAPVGYALFAYARKQGAPLVAAAFFTTYFLVGLAWSLEFAIVAFIGLMFIEVLLSTLPFLLPVRSPWAFPAFVTVAELLRYRWPLGGLPLAGVALGQANGPLLPLGRLGGDLLIVFVTALLGVGLYAVRRHWPFLVVAAAVIAAAWIVPTPKAGDPMRVAYAQGGGPRGLRAVENESTDVFGNQIRATHRLRKGLDLVLWPEDVIDLTGPIAADPVKYEVGKLATQLQTTLVAGVVEDSGEHHFRNAAVAWDRIGKIVDRFEKVHRVPFGEYVPARGLVQHVADISPVPRDAIAGKGDGVLLTRAGQLGVMISYEVFFADRARTAVHGGADPARTDQRLLVQGTSGAPPGGGRGAFARRRNGPRPHPGGAHGAFGVRHRERPRVPNVQIGAAGGGHSRPPQTPRHHSLCPFWRPTGRADGVCAGTG
jgi:apolipoprotein N-acyltransferase